MCRPGPQRSLRADHPHVILATDLRAERLRNLLKPGEDLASNLRGRQLRDTRPVAMCGQRLVTGE